MPRIMRYGALCYIPTPFNNKPRVIDSSHVSRAYIHRAYTALPPYSPGPIQFIDN